MSILSIFGSRKMTVFLVQIVCVMCAVKILLHMRKNKFVPRLSILGQRGAGKTRLFYALRDHQIVDSVHSLESSVFRGIIGVFQHEVEICDYSSDFQRWPKDWRSLLRQSLAILYIFKNENYEEEFEKISTKAPYIFQGLTFVVIKNDQLIIRLQAFLRRKQFNKRIIEAVARCRVIQADLSKESWDVRKLIPDLTAIL